MKPPLFSAPAPSVKIDGLCDKKYCHYSMYVTLTPQICISSPWKEQIINFSSDLLKSTEGSHRFALDFAADSVRFFSSHDLPYEISHNAISSIKNLMMYGDQFGTFLLSSYFTLIQILISPC